MKHFLTVLLVALSAAVAPHKALGSVRIDSLKTTESTCQNNGSITVYAVTNRPPISYSIIAGPVTRTQQAGNVFNSLPAGVYTVRVVNALSESATSIVTVVGNYRQPVFDPIKINPFCFGGSDGVIIGNLTAGTGKSPYTWQLVSPSPVTRPPQANDTFTNLPAGDYSIRVTDACGSFVTYIASLFNPNTKHNFGGVYVEIIGCDSALVTSFINLPENGKRLPLTFKYKTKNGILIPAAGSVVLDSTQINASPYGVVSTKQILAGINYGDTITTTVYNNCGDSAVSVNIIPPFRFYPTYVFKSCGSILNVAFSYPPNGNRSYGLRAPVKYIYADSATGVIADSATIKGDSTYFVYSMISSIGIRVSLVPGNTYTLTVTDGCGKQFQENFKAPVLEVPAIVGSVILNSACIDSMAGMVRVQVKNFSGTTRLILLSGPATAGSSRPGYSYSDTYAFPDTIPGTVAQQFFYLINMAPGTWQFKVEDDCGNVVYDSILIKNEDVTSLDKTVGYRKGCLGQNTILYSLTHGATVVAGSHFATVIITRLSDGSILKNQNYYTNAASDSLSNLSSGSYVVTFQFIRQGVGSYISNYHTCTTIHDTVVIENYQSPAILSSNSIVCNGGINVELLPDSTRGVPPYQYEIIAGPSIFPIQASNIFTPNIRGTYTARIYDACGNASTTSITVDTFSFSPLGQIKNGCNSFKFFYTSSAQYSYTWIVHGSQVFTGDTLIIDPLTPADTGAYYVSKIVEVNGCRDTFYTSFTVELPGQNHEYETICEGDSILFEGTFYNAAGVYSDTLIAIDGCDSINILHLDITAYKRDTLNAAICEGSSYLFNSSSYSLTGNYYDTLSTATCDSIVLLNLVVNAYKRDTFNISLCSGQSYMVGNSIYSQTGIYTDTLATLSCDSIVLLNLYVNDYKRDTLNIIICEGQSFAIGANNYTATGIYTDTLSTLSCDSIVLLNLTVNPLKRDTLSITICEGQNFAVGANNYFLNGIYIDTLSTSSCDSIVVLNLTVNPYKRDTLFQTICEGQSFIVGASNYTATGIYRDTLSTLSCDSIVLLNLSVNPYKRDTLFQTICEGQSFAMGSNNYAATGVYTDTLSTLSCDSIVLLNLTVNPYKRDSLTLSICSGQSFIVGANNYSTTGIYIDTLITSSCDSIVVLNLTVNDYKRETINISICEGQEYIVGNNSYSLAGTYSDTLPTSTCDSIVTLNLLVNPYKRDTLFKTICEGQNFIVGANNYSTTGVYIDTLNTAGCDSIVLLNLTVNPYKRDTLFKTICEGQGFTLGTTIYSVTGVYTDTLATLSCDSIILLNLTVNPYKRDTLFKTICEGQSFTVGTNNYTISGVYTDTLATLSCDSIVLLNLTVNPYKRDTLNITICNTESYTVGIHQYTQTGVYRDTLTTATCDSIVLLNLTVTLYKRNALDITICEGGNFSVGNSTYTQTGVYNDTLPTLTCDSIVTLTLTVNPYKRISINETICEGQGFTVGTNTYNESGLYVDTLNTTGCDSIVALSLTVNPYKRSSVNATVCQGQQYLFNNQNYSSAGIYTDTLSTSSCDSIVTLTLAITPYKRGDTTIHTICEGEIFEFGGNAYSSTGIYFDTLSTATCDSIIALNLTVSPAPAAHITATPQTVNPGSGVELNTPTAATYLWKTAARLSDSSIQNPSAVFYQSAWIFLYTTSNENNCTATDSVYITVRTDTVIVPPCNGKSYIYLPNAFVPGSQFGNSIFRIYSSNIRLVQFQVFNKWGQTVFATSNITDGWNGIYKEKITPGNYVYRVTYYDCNPNVLKVKAGNIILIK